MPALAGIFAATYPAISKTVLGSGSLRRAGASPS